MLDDYLQFVNYMLMSGCTESWWCVTRVLASRHLLLRVSTLCQLPPAQRSDLALEKVTRASHSHQPRDAGLPPACPCHVSIQRFVIFFSEFMGWHHHRLVLRLSAKNYYKPIPDTVIDLTVVDDMGETVLVGNSNSFLSSIKPSVKKVSIQKHL